jgi:hypothetical protein
VKFSSGARTSEAPKYTPGFGKIKKNRDIAKEMAETGVESKRG